MPIGPSTQRAPEGEPRLAPADAAPSKRDLVSWWKQFKRTNKKEEEKVEEPGSVIFAVPLAVSISYANVAISLFDAEGRSFIYGYVPIVVAKCGVFLKEKATEVEGIFRLAGATRRINELYQQFNTPERFGKGLDWTGYTVHDAANVLRRYLNSLPEPVVPLDFYERFREPLRHHHAQEAGGEQHQQEPENGTFNVDSAIKMYQQLITELPPLNRQLLLYLLDLLAVFAAKSDLNLMTSYNLSAIFQPALLFHPIHTMAPSEYRLSQDVLIFLIENQDHFLVGMQGTAADEKTIEEVQGGVLSPQKPAGGPTTPKGRTLQFLGRSASTASGGSESARRFSAMHRNVSVSSKNSRQSNHAPSPVTPPLGSPLVSGGKGTGVHRSNTLPSKKSPSPALGSDRFSRERGPEALVQGLGGQGAQLKVSPLSSGSTTPGLAPVSEAPPNPSLAFVTSTASPPSKSPQLNPALADAGLNSIQDQQHSMGEVSPLGTPARDRTIGNLFKPSSGADVEKKDGRRANKLQKKRAPEGLVNPRDSTHSLSGGSYPPSPAHPPYATTSRHGSYHQSDPPRNASLVADGGESAIFVTARSSPDARILPENANMTPSGNVLNPNRSPTGSVVSSGSSSERAGAGDLEGKKKTKRRWRMSSSTKKQATHLNGTNLGLAPGAERSSSTVGSFSRSRKSMTDESNASAKPPTGGEERVGAPAPADKKGPFGWIKDKLQRAKSPVPAGAGADAAKSKQSLTAVATNSDTSQGRGRSVEAFGEVSKEEAGNEK